MRQNFYKTLDWINTSNHILMIHTYYLAFVWNHYHHKTGEIVLKNEKGLNPQSTSECKYDPLHSSNVICVKRLEELQRGE